MSEKIVVIGLGYVGLPLLIGLAKKFPDIVGFDVDTRRVQALLKHHDWTEEISPEELQTTTARITADPAMLTDRSFYIVTVPTPIDSAKRPDLTPVLSACDSIGLALKQHQGGGKLPLVVFESTVYPGLTEETCGPRIARASGKTHGTDFKLGYSPERINPGDQLHRLETITKIIAAEDVESLARLETVYGSIIEAGLHKAQSIAVAEAAKVLENTQRDLNVALMNELALICDRLNIRTADVLAAAGTKWNFLKFSPGLVGGHCIGVDPYYLTTRAESLGYHPQVILAGRRINDHVPVFIAEKLMKLMNLAKTNGQPRIGMLGLAFKENVHDLRNSRVPDIVRELRQYGCEVLIHDPLADPEHARHEYNLELSSADALRDLDALVLAVPHRVIMSDIQNWLQRIKPQGVMADIKSAIDPSTVPAQLRYWSL
jgi:UDP-N-acetyl-D-galactosamine dehydrogenase